MRLDEAQLSHLLVGRLRVKVPTRRHDAAFFADVSRRLAQCDGVTQVRVSPVTGSVLVLHSTTLDAIAAYAAQQGLFSLTTGRITSDGTPHSRSRAAMPSGPAQSDGERERSDRRARMISTTLTGLGTLQTVRVQIMAPALTLFWYAYDAWRSRPSTRGGGPPALSPSAPREPE